MITCDAKPDSTRHDMKSLDSPLSSHCQAFRLDRSCCCGFAAGSDILMRARGADRPHGECVGYPLSASQALSIIVVLQSRLCRRWPKQTMTRCKMRNSFECLSSPLQLCWRTYLRTSGIKSGENFQCPVSVIQVTACRVEAEQARLQPALCDRY